MTTTPEPGVYKGVPFAEYTAWDAASNSRLQLLRKSPAHLKRTLDGYGEETEALTFGRHVHTCVLEPERFEREYILDIEGDGRTKAVKEARAKLRADNPGKEIISKADYAAAVAMRDSVRSREAARRVLSGGVAELSIVWVDPETGLLCKARLDYHAPHLAGGTITDLKSTVDASLEGFERSIAKYGYHCQGAMYLDGARACDLDAEHFVFLPVEKGSNLAAGPYRLEDDAIEAGRQETRALLRLYAECVEHDSWPGYPDEVQDIGLPVWARPRVAFATGGIAA